MSARSRPIGSIVRSQVYVRDDGPFEAPHPPTALFRCRSGDEALREAADRVLRGRSTLISAVASSSSESPDLERAGPALCERS